MIFLEKAKVWFLFCLLPINRAGLLFEPFVFGSCGHVLVYMGQIAGGSNGDGINMKGRNICDKNGRQITNSLMMISNQPIDQLPP
jgi:hypothetical protein